MTERDRPAFAEAMYLLGETFNEQVSEIRSEGYFDALREFDIAQVNAAVRLALRTCKFFPKPVELRELLLGDREANADAAWSALIAEVRRVGYLGWPSFDDENIMRTVKDIWGHWHRLCETLPGEGPELVGWIKQFKSAYGTVQRRDERKQLEAAKVPAGIRASVQQIADAKRMR